MSKNDSWMDMSVLSSLIVPICVASWLYRFWLWLLALLSHLRLLSLLLPFFIAVLYDPHHTLKLLEIDLVVAVLICLLAYLLPCLVIGDHVRQSPCHHPRYLRDLDATCWLVSVQVKSRPQGFFNELFIFHHYGGAPFLERDAAVFVLLCFVEDLDCPGSCNVLIHSLVQLSVTINKLGFADHPVTV